MKKWSFFFVSILLCLTAVAQCQAQQNGRQFITAMEAYKSGDYPTSIDSLAAIAKTGVQNGALYYNLGNAHLKNNDLGRAILWYERALKLSPNDPDLRFNYDYAKSLTKDAVEEETTPLTRIIFFWKYQLSTRAVIYLALGFNMLFWSLHMARRVTGLRAMRYAVMTAFIPTLVFILTAGFNYYEETHRHQAIVLSEKVSIRSGLENTSTELFILHAGAKVKIVREMQDHFQIRYSKKKIGWVDKNTISLI